MHSTRPAVFDDDPAALDVLWHALHPEPGGPDVRIRAVMISSVDGTTAVDGRSGPLGTPTDRLVYDEMRWRIAALLTQYPQAEPARCGFPPEWERLMGGM